MEAARFPETLGAIYAASRHSQVRKFVIFVPFFYRYL
jgi:hypothetical protein